MSPPSRTVAVDVAAAAAALLASQVPAPKAAGTCPLGHQNVEGARFCASCGLAMDAMVLSERPRPEELRPRPTAELSVEERAERDRQHAAALHAAAQFERSAPEPLPVPRAEAITIHFVEDGFTFAGRVWYRGQELRIGPESPRWTDVLGWIMLDKWAQVARYGRQFFDQGPWAGRQAEPGTESDLRTAPVERGGSPVTYLEVGGITPVAR